MHNRELFRAVNQRIAAVVTRLDVVDVPQGFICECSHLGCTVQIPIAPEVYTRVLATPSGYLVRPGHEDTAAEEVAEATGEYLIVIERHD